MHLPMESGEKFFLDILFYRIPAALTIFANHAAPNDIEFGAVLSWQSRAVSFDNFQLSRALTTF